LIESIEFRHAQLDIRRLNSHRAARKLVAVESFMPIKEKKDYDNKATASEIILKTSLKELGTSSRYGKGGWY
jgi:hypothetical protein